ncbi:MAG: zinc ribbon domain-containing protein [Planctomycetota bacterium]
MTDQIARPRPTPEPPPEDIEWQSSARASEDIGFRCPNCAAETIWDPKADALVCGHCDTHVQVPRGEGTVLERPLDEAGEAARGLGIVRRVVRCDNCGATVSLDTTATADACTYCGSSRVLEQDANRNAIRPESLIPLDVCRDRVEQKFRKWLGGLWFRPNALKNIERFDAMGVYVPFWTFDCEVHSEWSADAGYYYYVTQTYTTMVNGRPQVRTRQVRKVRWVPKWGSRDDAYDDIHVPASQGVPQHLIMELGVFDTRELVPYRPEYLAGWRAEEYQLDLETGWTHAEASVVESQRQRCSGDVPGDTQRHLRVRNEISDVHWKHVLLPLWVLQYRFKDRIYAVLVHGQTGKVVGEAPYSWLKITAAALAVLSVAGGLIAVVGR